MAEIKGVCPTCKTEFIKGSAKQKYCKPTCRPSAYTPTATTKKDPCAVCPEKPRCPDTDHPESCRVWRINTKDARWQQANKDRSQIVQTKQKDDADPLPEGNLREAKTCPKCGKEFAPIPGSRELCYDCKPSKIAEKYIKEKPNFADMQLSDASTGMRRFQRKAALMSAIAGCVETYGMATGDVKPLLLEITKEM